MGNSCFLDKNSPIEKCESGDLPHWFQPEKVQFVTFRLADSLPLSKIEELNAIKNRFFANNPQPWDEKTNLNYHRIMGNHNEKVLDMGLGACVLRNEKCRKVLSGALHFFDDVRCKIIAYVIMPNHVHLLIQPLGEEDVADIIGSIKRFSAKEINKLNGKSGTLWQRECWDRIVRSGKDLSRNFDYIKQNPRNQKEGEYEVYVCPEFR